MDAMHDTCDVAIIGGAFSGAATALLLKRRAPDLRVVIVEKAPEFDRKVGESTTEVSSCFLTRVLGLSTYLGHEQLAKQGLRMWFANSPEQPFDECVEIGARYNSRLSGFQVDRAKLDEHVLKLAAEAGCELLRPAKVVDVELRDTTASGDTPVAASAARRQECRLSSEIPDHANILKIKLGDETRTIRAKWLVDASGRAAVLARKLGLFTPLDAHPINALWARFTGVRDWDGHELRNKFPRWANAARTGRAWATNHLMGLGWWCWIIPLKGGDYSIGIVYDTRLFQPPAGASIGERLKAHFRTHPVGREILSGAEPIEGDQRAYSMLPYFADRVMGDGWALVGDAANFIDPLYSPGLDICSYTAHRAHTLISRALAGEAIADEVEKYNAQFAFCYHSWFDSIYRDKYFYMGDAELMSAAFLLDIALYYGGLVRYVYDDPERGFDLLPFSGAGGKFAAHAIAFYNRRLAALARKKIAAGRYGDRNANWRLLIPGFLPDASLARPLARGLLRWLRAEMRCAFMPPAAPAIASPPHKAEPAACRVGE
jgi:flavin-dependent dehydrogenase